MTKQELDHILDGYIHITQGNDNHLMFAYKTNEELEIKIRAFIVRAADYDFYLAMAKGEGGVYLIIEQVLADRSFIDEVFTDKAEEAEAFFHKWAVHKIRYKYDV